MTLDLALTIASPFLGLGVPALLLVMGVLTLGGRPDPPPMRDDRSWRAEMLRLVAASKLADELRAARTEIARRRAQDDNTSWCFAHSDATVAT